MENPDEFLEAKCFDADAQNESGSVAEAVCPCIEKRKKLLRDAVLIFALLLISGAVVLFLFLTRERGGYVEVTQDGTLIGTYSLAIDRTVTLNGGTNVLEIEDGGAYLSYAACPDRTCVNTGKIMYNGQSIVCLPNRITVKVISADGGGVDFVS